MEMRRGDLKDNEVDLIMGLKKFNELIKRRRINEAKLSSMSNQDICGVDAFVDISDDDLIPDMPPILAVPTLNGTNRKPLRMWHMCGEEEKNLEL